MMYDKTIVILTPGFPDSETDSACLPAQQHFLLSLKNNFPRTNFIVLSFQYPYSDKSYRWHDIPVKPFNGRNRGKLHRLLLWQKVLKEMEAIHARQSIAGIISFWYGECSLVGKRFSARYRIPHICWLLGQDARLGNKYVQRVGLAAGEMVAISDFVADELEKNYAVRPAHVIPIGIPENTLSLPLHRDIDVAGIGSLIPLKRYNLFIDGIHHAIRYFPNLRAVICGKGPEAGSLLQHIEKCGLQSHIQLAGEMDHASVLSLLQRTRILLHPSSYEGFSSACLEALAAGTRVISFCQPMHENIPGWNTVNSLPEMENRLVELLSAENMPEPSTPYRVGDSAIKMMALFSQQAQTQTLQLAGNPLR